MRGQHRAGRCWKNMSIPKCNAKLARCFATVEVARNGNGCQNPNLCHTVAPQAA